MWWKKKIKEVRIKPTLHEECKPPFVVNGETHYSFMCCVGNGTEFPYYTFVYARDKEDAKIKLDEQYSYFDIKYLVHEKDKD